MHLPVGNHLPLPASRKRRKKNKDSKSVAFRRFPLKPAPTSKGKWFKPGQRRRVPCQLVESGFGFPVRPMGRGLIIFPPPPPTPHSSLTQTRALSCPKDPETKGSPFVATTKNVRSALGNRDKSCNQTAATPTTIKSQSKSGIHIVYPKELRRWISAAIYGKGIVPD